MDEVTIVKDLSTRYNKIVSMVSNAALRSGRNPDDIKVIAVSKTHPHEIINFGIKAGIRAFGENYAQEMRDKFNYLNENNIKQPDWHFIGHLQSNKVKYIAPFVNMIHSVDSLRLAEEISEQANKFERKIDILIQVNSSGEMTKSGIESKDLFSLIEKSYKLPDIKISGLMTIGSFSYDEAISRKEFRFMKKLFDEARFKFPELDLKDLSMGMSHDFEAAIEEGSNIVRVGTAIFGERDYK
jgi:hypothetical protein